jgi:predicted lipid-binding transport protein (Tim44 family)
MRRRTLILTLALATALVALIAAPAALAAAGGGTYGFGGGGSGGGGGGRGHSAFEIYIIFRLLIDIARLGHGAGLIVLIALALAVWFFRSGWPKFREAAAAREQRGRARTRETRRRERKVELAAAEAADEDPVFGPASVRTAAAELFTNIQLAWSGDDRIALRGLVAPGLLAEWERRLDDFRGKGWRNHVEPLAPPTVEYVGLARAGDGPQDIATPDRVVVRIEARMRDYVTDAQGRRIKCRGQFTETVRLREYWTLERRSDHWVLASIEQGAEGTHALTDKIVQTSWADEQRLRDEAMVEQAVADAAPPTVRIAELADLDFAGDARAAANDLSLADGRFAPDVLEVAARRAVDAWAQAVDGSDTELRALATPEAVSELLHPSDPSGQTRLVVRGPQLERIVIVDLDAASEPATMTIDVHLQGRRYIEERSTTRVLAGNPARSARFTERWTLALSGDETHPWKIVAVRTPAVTA